MYFCSENYSSYTVNLAKSYNNMKAFGVFVLVLVVCYILYYGTTILMSLMKKPADDKSKVETFEVDEDGEYVEDDSSESDSHDSEKLEN